MVGQVTGLGQVTGVGVGQTVGVGLGHTTGVGVGQTVGVGVGHVVGFGVEQTVGVGVGHTGHAFGVRVGQVTGVVEVVLDTCFVVWDVDDTPELLDKVLDEVTGADVEFGGCVVVLGVALEERIEDEKFGLVLRRVVEELCLVGVAGNKEMVGGHDAGVWVGQLQLLELFDTFVSLI